MKQISWWLFVIVFVLPVAAAALGESAGLVPLPYVLEPLAARLPVTFAVHMGASALSLPLIVLALTLRPPHRLHRWLGRGAALCVLVGGLSAIPVSLASDALPAARLGFLAQGLVWLALLAMGIAAARARRFRRHRRAMMMMAATASGAIVLRLLLYPVAWLWLPYGESYAVIAWAAWLAPLTATYLLTREARPAGRRAAASRMPARAA